MSQGAREHLPICPKCGYDQSGEIATWQERCPLEGVCPECGLGFGWADVFDPSRVHADWYVEHTNRVRLMIRRTPGTLWFLLFPNRFWKRLGVESPVYPLRVWAWLGAIAFFSYLLTGALATAVAAHSTMQWNRMYSNLKATNPQMAAQVNLPITDFSDPSYWTGLVHDSFIGVFTNSSGITQNAMQFVMLLGGMTLLWVVILSVVPTTRRLAKIRLAHLHRAGALSCTAIIATYLISVMSDSTVNVLARLGMTMNASGSGSFMLAQSRFAQAEYYGRLIMTGVFIYAAVWTQWFWISAVVIGWRVRSFTLLLLGLIASLLAGFTVAMYLAAY